LNARDMFLVHRSQNIATDPSEAINSKVSHK
jgi:hypothetical protein